MNDRRCKDCRADVVGVGKKGEKGMKQNITLPKTCIKCLEAYHVAEEEIRYAAQFDVAEDYSFTKGFLVLTGDKLILVRYPKTGGRQEEFRFGGYVTKWNGAEEEKPVLTVYENKDVESLSIVREITGGVLLGKIKGIEYNLCRFTNSRMGEMERLTANIEKLKKGEELTSEDIEGKNPMECCPKCGTLYPDQERKVCPKCMDKKSIFGRLLSYFLVYKVQIVVMLLCYVVTAVLNMVFPYLSGTILYDKVLSKDAAFMEMVGAPAGRVTVLLGMTVLAMLVSKLLMQCAGMLHGALTAKIAPEVVAKLKQQVFASMGRLSISFYNRKQTGGLMTRVLDDAQDITEFFIDGVPYFFVNIFTIIMTCIILFRLNAVLAFASLLLLPILLTVSYKLMPRLWNFYSKRHRANRRLNSIMNDNLTGARVVKAFGQEDQEMKRFDKSVGGVRTSELDVARFDNVYYAMYAITEQICSYIVWGLGAVLLLHSSTMEFGLLITFTGYIAQLNGPLDFMSYVFRWWTSCINSAQRIFEIIDAVPEVAEKKNPVRPENIRGEIDLSHVTFGYEAHKPVLKDVSFHVEAGKVLGIVGRSGAGKSTLVNLISRLYDVEDGAITIDGINVKDMGFRELRKNVAMVSQETYIFMGTVAENIAYARPDATRKEIIEAAIQASAHDFICKMPEGYDTVLGASGRSLSGGEKQRISIARAILANPKILILDEATAAVDTETELAIQESLEKLVQGRTTLSIAHRLSTLRNADKLIVMEDGKVTEEGTHKELIKKKGTYFKLMELQTKALAMRGIVAE